MAALAPPADLPAMLHDLETSVLGPVFGSFVVDAYAAHYPEVAVRDYVRPGARIGLDEMSHRCLTDPSTLVSVGIAVYGGASVWRGDLASGPLRDRLAENVPVAAITAPLLIGHGEQDELIPLEVQDAYVAQRCAAGQVVDYRSYAAVGHVALTAADSPLIPELFAWTTDRFAGEVAIGECVVHRR